MSFDITSPYDTTSLYLWLRYAIDCEEYDRTQPCIQRHGEWIPIDNGLANGRTNSVAFARQQKSIVIDELRSLGVPPEVWSPVKRYTENLSLEEAKRELAYLRGVLPKGVTRELPVYRPLPACRVRQKGCNES